MYHIYSFPYPYVPQSLDLVVAESLDSYDASLPQLRIGCRRFELHGDGFFLPEILDTWYIRWEAEFRPNGDGYQGDDVLVLLPLDVACDR